MTEPIKSKTSDSHGIKTLLNGRMYRSLLEAKWASFFEWIDFKNEYEPFELPGWIPDFMLIGKKNILAEVKPFTTLEQFDIKKILRAANDEYPILLLGVAPFGDDDENFNLGWIRNPGESNWDSALVQMIDFPETEKLLLELSKLERTFDAIKHCLPSSGQDAWIQFREENGFDDRKIRICTGRRLTFDICQSTGSYKGYLTGYSDGSPHGRKFSDLIKAWNHSANSVQWRPS